MSKIYIDLPALSQFSNGTKCIKALRDYLVLCGFNVISLSRETQMSKIKAFFFRKKIFDYKNNQFLNATKNDWLITCDTTSLPLLEIARKKGLNIAWWQLAPYNFLGNSQFPLPGEYSLPFSSYCDPSANEFYYYQPSVDKYWAEALKVSSDIEQTIKPSICFYTGKGRLTKLPELIRKLCKNYELQLITRQFPSSRKEYFNLLNESKALISFDEMSQTNLEAASLGLPVFIVNSIFPEESINKFNIKEYKERVTRSPEVFYEMLCHSKRKLPKLKKSYLESFNNESFKKFSLLIKDKGFFKNVTKSSLANFENHSKVLKKKNLICPFFLWGQSFGIVLASTYLTNLKNKRKYKMIVYLIYLMDEIGKILYKTKILKIFILFYNICDILNSKYFPKV
tara:strand:+ start:5557 stop:6747 length:1191 start_codon:yes stop_codon:yes gene_type:complete